MNFQYRFKLPVPVEQAWPVLLDVRRVAPCMPGAGIESGEGNDYVGRMKVKLGPIEMAYRGDLHFVERDDAAHRLKVEGVGKEVRGGGGAKALVTMQASSVPGGCEIAIDSEYELNGRAAQFGTGMIDEIGGKLMQEFARRLEKLILNSNAQESGPTVAAAPAPSIPQPAPTASAPAGGKDWAVDDNEALDLVGLAWGPVLSRSLPVIHLLISTATLIYLLTHK
ncbi:SRPBCC family protein [Sphingobium sp. EM0848]|uniref:SRPBCC family protein n=1 Tax=Sphingobium sp. EM0848 TaxID=2743473 RepID=UPI00159C124C